MTTGFSNQKSLTFLTRAALVEWGAKRRLEYVQEGRERERM